LELARRAYHLKPKAPWVGRELIMLEVDQGEWGNAMRLLKQTEKRHLIGGDESLRQRVALLMAQSQQAEQDGAPAQALAQAQKALAISSIPAAMTVIRILGQQGSQRKADRVLHQAWRQNPHPALAELALTMLPGESPDNRLNRLRDLTKTNADHPESRYLIARAAKDAGDFALARDVIAPALQGRPDKLVCRFMATLNEAQGRDMDAAREWLRRASNAPAAKGWKCESCHESADDWRVNCPACGEFASLSWPPESVIGPAEEVEAEERTPIEAIEITNLVSDPETITDDSTTEPSTVGAKAL